MQQAEIYTEWLQNRKEAKKSLAVLIDPDKANKKHLKALCTKANDGAIQYFFVGGSLMSTNALDMVIDYLKTNVSIPVILFPGSTMQVNLKADAILFLSLISGRNPDLLIGKHVEIAPFLFNSKLEKISTGYMLIDGGKPTSVSYMSNSLPIPSDKAEIALATAMAGNMLGLQCNYLEAGSGAAFAVSEKMIQLIATKINAPLLVGGGIRDAKTAQKTLAAGADIIVVGTKIESNLDFIDELAQIINHKKS